jgi:RNA polymerase sigma-70 factor (sigma-E family)
VSQDVTTSFEAFYTGTAPRLLRYAYGLTGDLAEAQDFTQEAYARAWPRWQRLRQYENPESWLRLVVNRLATDRLRRLRVRRERASPEATVVPPPGEEMLTLIAALKQLPVAQRKALVLHYFLDMPVADIAAETGTNINTVKTWLARGRVNAAAQLTEVPQQSIHGVRRRAAQRRNRTIVTSFAALLATATAATAAFFAIPKSVPPTLRPDLVLPYSQAPARTQPVLVGDRVVTLWHAERKAFAGAIDLKTGRQAWPAITVGDYDDLFMAIGSHDGVVVTLGGNDSSPRGENYTLTGIDAATGKVHWQHPPRSGGRPLLDLAGLSGAPDPAETGILAISDGASVSGIDWLTGDPVWTLQGPQETRYTPPDQGRFAQIRPDGTLRVVDLRTGRVTGERTGVPRPPNMEPILIGEWLYLTDAGGVKRLPISGDEPPSLLTGNTVRGPVSPCGKQVCVNKTGSVEAFDRRTGEPVWRRDIKEYSTIRATQLGTILSIAGTGPKDDWGRAPDDHQTILDPDGKDITPGNLGTRTAYWLGGEHLILMQALERAVVTGNNISPADDVELSVYSLKDGVEQPLGRHRLRDGCTGIPYTSYVCAGEHGFILFH